MPEEPIVTTTVVAEEPSPTPEGSSPTPSKKVAVPAKNRGLRTAPAVTALVVGLAALTATAGETELVRDIQRYCAVCWRNAHLDPSLWDDCTQEVCCRLLAKARAGELDLNLVLADDTQERRELVRAIDMVRKRVQRSKKYQPLEAASGASSTADDRDRERLELGEILEAARREVLSPRQDRIVELWTRGWPVPEIADHLGLSPARVSDEKYKALRKLERHLAGRRDELDLPVAIDEDEVRLVG